VALGLPEQKQDIPTIDRVKFHSFGILDGIVRVEAWLVYFLLSNPLTEGEVWGGLDCSSY